MKKTLPILVLVLLGLGIWWFASDSGVSAVTELPGGQGAPIRASLTVNPTQPTTSGETTMIFAFTDTAGNPADLMAHHARKVHVVIIPEDHASLGHIHPEDFPALNQSLPQGQYAVSYAFPQAGRYIVAVDVMDSAGSLAKQFIVNVTGTPAMGTAAADSAIEKCFAGYPEQGEDRRVEPVIFASATLACPQGYDVTFMPPSSIRAGVPVQFGFMVKENGKPVTDLVPVMSAGVHFAIVPDSFDSVMHRHGNPGMPEATDADSDAHDHDAASEHVLPSQFGPNLVSEPLVFPKPGHYTIFLEFKQGKELIYGRFGFDVGEGVAATGETKMLMLTIKGKKVTSTTSGVWSVNEGDTVMFHIMADAPEELHVHGYNKMVEFPANKETTLTFFADTAGRFPMELENSKTDIGVLEVLPK